MRRKQGTLVPLEQAILAVGLELRRQGLPDFHGYALARLLRDAQGASSLVAHGTLYKALERLEGAGFVASAWEDPKEAEHENRPRRRLYRVTPAGERALAAQAASLPSRAAVAGTSQV